jgi:DNA-directed RNA polymerase subunit RPC12/RpoP
MMSHRGIRIAFEDRLGKFEEHRYLCLSCKKESATNKHWDKRRDKKLVKCPHCGIGDEA